MNERKATPTVPDADPAPNGASGAPGATAATAARPAPSRPDATGPIGPVPLGRSGSAAATGGTAASSDGAEEGPEPGSSPDRDGADAARPGSGPATGPVVARPSVRPRVAGPLTRMGPWAPLAGGLVGVLLGVVAVVFLAGVAGRFQERLSLVFLVAGLGLVGASATLLADEVRVGRWRAREAAVRPAAWIDTTAGLLNGLTPARLLLLVGGFVLFLAAWTAIG